MKKITLFLAAAFLFGCNTQQKVVVAPGPDMEFRQLDTMVVTANKRQAGTETENYSLPVYHPSRKRENDLLHTRLNLRFDWEKEQVIGIAALTLTPYFYPSDKAVLDAKGFEFQKISMEGSEQPLHYTYDGEQVVVQLGRQYRKGEKYTLNISYTAMPSESGGSAAITSDKGLFFINPRGEDIDKPRQIWTQGETENNSRWFPTIDSPNERCTQEVYLTVDSSMQTLSNGLLISSTNNGDGTRTDYWKMDQPHAPYLFMLAIGKYAVVKEDWEGKPVWYYVEPEYEKDATAIFAHTKEMLSFFSDKLKVKYPWPKFAQVVVRDYVSGAMENTTCVVFGEPVQRHRRELIDDNNDQIVAHEMFHHWFGDLVTCESWANLTLNEGFANYSEYLWFEHQYGADEADYHLLNEWSGYLSAARGGIHPLIDFGYGDKEDMFDSHSYNKGGAILHMLRSYLGDDAFWAGLNLYLTENAYSSVEAHNLRLAFEAVSGEDLNWFFNQWYFSEGHPELNVTYGYDAAKEQVTVKVEQTQDPTQMPAIFELPVAIDLYLEDGKTERKEVRVRERVQTFTFDAKQEPRLVTFDAKRMLLAEVQDNKTESQLIYQFYHAPKFLDRYESLQRLQGSSSPQARKVMEDALSGPFWAIRGLAISTIDESAGENVRAQLRQMATGDPHSQVRTGAFEKLMELDDASASEEAKAAIGHDSSYAVIGSALQYLSLFDKPAALEYASLLEEEEIDGLLLAIGEIYVESENPRYLSFFEKHAGHIKGFSAIYFLDGYQQLATMSGLEATKAAASKLQALALDDTQLSWRRYAATRALNEMRKTYSDGQGNGKPEMAASLMEMIKTIRKKETNAQLQSYYDQMMPDIRP
ncbi:MAG: DUF3458 domain-containing protein [Lewinellaceae bacterium]|nr:DUF3458 domain-containing protein [Lewinellaceae bacterium]